MTVGRPRRHLRETTVDQRAARARWPPPARRTARWSPPASRRAGRGRQGRTWTAPAGPRAAALAGRPRARPAAAAARRPRGRRPRRPGRAGQVAERRAARRPQGRRRARRGAAAGGLGGGRDRRQRGVRAGRAAAGAATRARSAGGPSELEATLDELLGRSAVASPSPPPRRSPRCARATRCSTARVSWPGGEGVGAGIDEDGRLRVRGPGGEQVLDAGEVHLQVERRLADERLAVASSCGRRPAASRTAARTRSLAASSRFGSGAVAWPASAAPARFAPAARRFGSAASARGLGRASAAWRAWRRLGAAPWPARSARARRRLGAARSAGDASRTGLDGRLAATAAGAALGALRPRLRRRRRRRFARLAGLAGASSSAPRRPARRASAVGRRPLRAPRARAGFFGGASSPAGSVDRLSIATLSAAATTSGAAASPALLPAPPSLGLAAALREVAQQLAGERGRLARHPRAGAVDDLARLGRVRERGRQQRRGQPPVLLARRVHEPPRVARVGAAGRVDEQAEQPLGLRPALHGVLLVHVARHVRAAPDPVVGLVAPADLLLGQRLEHDLHALALVVARPRLDEVQRAVERLGVAPARRSPAAPSAAAAGSCCARPPWSGTCA